MSLPTALTYLYTSEAEIDDLASKDGVTLRLDDDADGWANSTEKVRLTTNAVNFGTAKCNLFLLCRYTAAQLVNSWQVHEWATTCALRWLCRRRLNPVPESIQDEYNSALAEMLSVRNHELDLTDILERESDQPQVTVQRLDNRYTVKQLRREGPLSDNRHSVIPATMDFPAEIIAAAEGYP